MIKRFLCWLNIHYYNVTAGEGRFVSQCRWCHTYEKGYEP